MIEIEWGGKRFEFPDEASAREAGFNIPTKQSKPEPVLEPKPKPEGQSK